MPIATRELRVVVSLATEDAEAGSTRVEEGIRRIGSRAKETGDEGSSAFDKLERSIEGVASPGEDLVALLGRLDTAGVAPITLARNAEKAQASLNLLRQELLANETAVEGLGPEITEQLGKAQAAIDAAKAKAKALGDEWERIGQTPTKLDLLIAELRKSGIESDQLAKGIVGVRQALEATREAWNSPRELQQAAQRAAVQVEDLRQEIEQAKASGQGIGEKTSAELREMQDELRKARVRLGELRDATADFRAQSDLAGNTMETVSGQISSVEGQFGLLANSTDKGISSFGKLGLATFGIVEGFKAAAQVGEAVGKTFGGIYGEAERLGASGIAQTFKLMATEGLGFAEAADRVGAAQQKAGIEGIKLEAIQRLVAKGLIDGTKSTQEQIREFDLLQIASGRVRASQEQLARIGFELPKSFDSVSRAGQEMEANLAGAFKRSAAEALEWGVTNSGAIQEFEEDARRMGITVPEHLKKVLAALKELSAEDHLKILEKSLLDLGPAVVALQKRIDELGEGNLDLWVERFGGELLQLADAYLKAGLSIDANWTAKMKEALLKARDFHEGLKNVKTGLEVFGDIKLPVIDRIQDLERWGRQLATAFETAYGRGQESAERFVKANEDVLREAERQYKSFGAAIPPALAQALFDLDRLTRQTGASGQAADGARQAWERFRAVVQGAQPIVAGEAADWPVHRALEKLRDHSAEASAEVDGLKEQMRTTSMTAEQYAAAERDVAVAQKEAQEAAANVARALNDVGVQAALAEERSRALSGAMQLLATNVYERWAPAQKEISAEVAATAQELAKLAYEMGPVFQPVLGVLITRWKEGTLSTREFHAAVQALLSGPMAQWNVAGVTAQDFFQIIKDGAGEATAAVSDLGSAVDRMVGRVTEAGKTLRAEMASWRGAASQTAEEVSQNLGLIGRSASDSTDTLAHQINTRGAR